jgi:hypothetical protein
VCWDSALVLCQTDMMSQLAYITKELKVRAVLSTRICRFLGNPVTKSC